MQHQTAVGHNKKLFKSNLLQKTKCRHCIDHTGPLVQSRRDLLLHMQCWPEPNICIVNDCILGEFLLRIPYVYRIYMVLANPIRLFTSSAFVAVHIFFLFFFYMKKRFRCKQALKMDKFTAGITSFLWILVSFTYANRTHVSTHTRMNPQQKQSYVGLARTIHS